MDALLIFDNLNDLIFNKCNAKFSEYIRDYAINQELIHEGDSQNEETIDNNVYIQIFSPIVTSHRIMQCQFGNTYTAMQFQDDLKIYFTEVSFFTNEGLSGLDILFSYMGYLFLNISNGNIEGFIEKCVVFARYVCGPDIYQLHIEDSKADLLCSLLDQWLELHSHSQSVYVEAIEQLVVNSDISSTCLHLLKDSVNYLVAQQDCSKVHALLLVEDKLLSLYSSVNASQLSSVDTLFSIILTQTKEKTETITSRQILLAGSDDDPKCIPHVVHIIHLVENVFLLYIFELGYTAVSATLYENFYHLHALQQVQIQRDKDTIQLAFENLELAVKRLNDNVKKIRNTSIETYHKQLMKQWDIIKGKYKDYLKTTQNDAILRAETLLHSYLGDLKEFYNLVSGSDSLMGTTKNYVINIIPKLKADLIIFTNFFQVKGVKNFELGSYMEDFPGLVHFIYIDRNTHRLTAPTLDMNAEKADFMRKKIWNMMSFAHTHLRQGHTSIIWRDMTFSYGYFLWFENQGGSPIKIPTNSTAIVFRTPGILDNDYFLKLKKTLLPKSSPTKIKCYELFCVHLGLTTPAGLLDQARKLAATVWELKGFPTHAIDFL
ncbi:Hermansky-Pudlak syndrome 1 protein isoform X2 [Rhynchophorus ferrugineus]|uniref:Hermansky-Pudlak syndrome 1 protein isoform X2 n=1 Tax=Rhynchophorus ferrugineus TaxID=354439 RepID=UPI003FCE4715